MAVCKIVVMPHGGKNCHEASLIYTSSPQTSKNLSTPEQLIANDSPLNKQATVVARCPQRYSGS